MSDYSKLKMIKSENSNQEIISIEENPPHYKDMPKGSEIEAIYIKEEPCYENEDSLHLTDSEDSEVENDMEIGETEPVFEDLKEESTDNVNVKEEELNFKEYDVHKSDPEDAVNKNYIQPKVSGNGADSYHDMHKYEVRPLNCTSSGCKEILSVSHSTENEYSFNTLQMPNNYEKHTVKNSFEDNERDSPSMLKDLKTEIKSHPIGGKVFNCNECDYIATHKSNLTRHIRIHTGEKPFKCSYCNYCASDQSRYKKHLRVHTGEKPYKCSYCDYSAAQKYCVQRHSRIHSGEKPYKCSYCDFTTSHNPTLKRHIRIHTGEKPYKCNICDFRTAHKSSYQNHQRVHTGEKPFKCSVCDFTTSLYSSLFGHMKVHSGDKTYKCTECNYTAAYKSSLTKHIKTHSGKK